MLIVIAIGGLVEIVPLFYLKSTIEKVDGVRPYTPLELAGRNIYVREGCYNLPFADDPAAARRGRALRPLFARGREHVRPAVPVGLEAHRVPISPASAANIPTTGTAIICKNPNSVVPGSVMPAYPWLARTDLDFAHIADDLKVQALLGVPYTPEMIANADADVRGAGDHRSVRSCRRCAKRYPKAQARDFDGNPGAITEADALIAYLQMLGTQVDFKLYDDKANIR